MAAWFSLPFIPDAVLDEAVAAVTRSLRPGGWLLTDTFAGPGELGMALARLRTARAGGRLLDPAGTRSLLAVHGLENNRHVPAGPGARHLDRGPQAARPAVTGSHGPWGMTGWPGGPAAFSRLGASLPRRSLCAQRLRYRDPGTGPGRQRGQRANHQQRTGHHGGQPPRRGGHPESPAGGTPNGHP